MEEGRSPIVINGVIRFMAVLSQQILTEDTSCVCSLEDGTVLMRGNVLEDRISISKFTMDRTRSCSALIE